MNDLFYSNVYNIFELITEMNRLSNTKYQEKLGYELAPLIYMEGKCYYFAKGLNSIVSNGKIYAISNPCHAFLKVGDYYFDARGMIYDGSEYDLKQSFPIDINNLQDRDFIDFYLTNKYDDKYLLPVLFQIAEESDTNIRKKHERMLVRSKNM